MTGTATHGNRLAVIGAGPAGLTAAYRLRQRGFDVDVFESGPVAGGRTHTEHHGDGHWVDTGAGWLAGFYPQTLALLDEIGQRDRLSPMQLRGGGDLLLDGRRHPTPNSVGRILSSDLLGPIDKARFVAYMARLFVTQRPNLEIDLDHDLESAIDALTPAGAAARECIVRPNFEGPFFARLEDMSGALVRSWLRALSIGTFFHVDGGMDAPWRHLAGLLNVQTDTAVERVEITGDGVTLHMPSGPARYDGGVVAIPAPSAAELVGPDDRPGWLDEVRYVPHVRLYAARRGPGEARRGVHIFPNDLVATVESGAGRFGGWGQIPDGWSWGLVCAPGASSAPLLEQPEEEVSERLWAEARLVDPMLFPLEDADVVQLIRWRHAVPDVGPGYHTRLRGFEQRPPLVFAGDWLVQPCVEGAVRSGIAAAERFGTAAR
jgi:protoporphyrinogen/coproporphyrinogen III oxidase